MNALSAFIMLLLLFVPFRSELGAMPKDWDKVEKALSQLDFEIGDAIRLGDAQKFSQMSRKLEESLKVRDWTHRSHIKIAEIAQRHSLMNLIPIFISNIDRSAYMGSIKSVNRTYPLTVPLVAFRTASINPILAAIGAENDKVRRRLFAEVLIGIRGVRRTAELLDNAMSKAKTDEERALLGAAKEHVERWGPTSIFLRNWVPPVTPQNLPIIAN